MNDLVERLRQYGEELNPHGHFKVCDEAADEIERLRERLKLIRAMAVDGIELQTVPMRQSTLLEIRRLADDLLSRGQ